ncbi:MAG: hypothetical protein CDV28_1265 [Candidatus Electronema aureum]|uniref:Uncharacterized protein n=1 Tax=Candidatus Electronema aureum TaxID=2005002 RepID=A0A521G0B2_9BACT|nr:MAG: hypothetical protein CDV28_1265 [Candidatus Electronema aureum]
MDIFTSAIMAALGNLGVKAVGDAYEGVKALVQRKFGADHKMTKAIEELEQEPDSDGWKLVLQEAAKKAGADKDAEIMKAVQALLDAVKAQPGGEKAIQQIINQQVSGSGHIFSGSGNVTVTK